MYAFRGAKGPSDRAAEVVAELERIRGRDGLRAPAVVEAAREEDSPLHGCFIWDDSEAGEAYRLIQARTLIRSVVLVREDRPPRTVYGHVPERGEGEYQPLEIIASRPDLYLAALAEAREDLAAAQRRVGELLEVARQGRHPRADIARIMLAAQALQTANEALSVIRN